MTDEEYMNMALELAESAAAIGEVPVGAVIVHENQVIARQFNRRECNQNPLAHAELLAIEEASQKLGRWRLQGCTLYVTLEPCIMCAGAIINARVDKVVFGAKDPKGGAVNSLYQLLSDPRLNHRPVVVQGVYEETCSHLLSSFFSSLRQQKKES